MTNEQIDKVKDLFGATFEPEVIEDKTDIDFDIPIRGKYICVIKKLVRYKGESDKCENGVYDMWTLTLQVQETVEGDPGMNRFLSKTYSNTAGKYQDDPMEGMQRLMNDLFTAGVEYTIERTDDMDAFDVIEQIVPQIIEQTVNVSAYPNKNKKQIVRIVKEFNIKKPKSEGNDNLDL